MRGDGVAAVGVNGGVLLERVDVARVADNGGASSLALYGGGIISNGISDLSPSIDAIKSFISFVDSSSFGDQITTDSLSDMEMDSMYFSPIFDPFTFKAFSPPFSQPFYLSNPPSSYTEAIAWPDASIWHSAMDRKQQSLAEMGAFEEVELPKGEKTVGLKWV